jgi:hypothetical protein
MNRRQLIRSNKERGSGISSVEEEDPASMRKQMKGQQKKLGFDKSSSDIM